MFTLATGLPPEADCAASRLLREAALVYLEAHGFPPSVLATSDNEFLYAAERAFWEMAQTFAPVAVADGPHKRQAVPYRLRIAVLERDRYRCLCCGTDVGLTMDHVEPVVDGGPSTYENLQTLCQPCNSRKGVHTIDYRPVAQ